MLIDRQIQADQEAYQRLWRPTMHARRRAAVWLITPANDAEEIKQLHAENADVVGFNYHRGADLTWANRQQKDRD